MKKARIKFNDVEKIVEITDDFYTDNRVSNEMAGMAMEESPFLNVPEEHRHTTNPNGYNIFYYENIYLPEDVAEKVFEETEIEKQYYVFYEKYCKKIISLIEEKFSVKVKEDAFYNEEFEVSEDDFKNDIVIHIEADDK